MDGLRSFADDAIKRRQPATASIAEGLRSAILKGVLKGGDPLRQDAIARQFEVSQVTVRDAFRLLEQEGLIDVVPRKGAVVSALSFDDVAEISELRASLEMRLIEAAIPHLTADDYAQAEATVTLIENATQADDLISLNNRFYQCLYRRARKPRSLAILEKLRLGLEPCLRLLWARHGYKRHSQEDHKQILKLCRAGMVAVAQDHLKRHVEKTGREIQQLLLETTAAKKTAPVEDSAQRKLL
jgi:DNA-binding GntR family transcriptional regulator